ncbi:MAG: hypothetical protein EP330_31170 [Deltaproteobacteria bacterium]|nr:MAG: hypothetical protein EP330_31170 [Deltaproteobacteria bacterium]
MIAFLLTLFLCAPARAAEWWVPLPADREPLREALDTLWSGESHQIVVGAAWSRDIEVVWVAGYVNRFDEGELVDRSPAESARTAVALARSWYAKSEPRAEWMPAGASAFDLDIGFGESLRDFVVEVESVERPAAARLSRRSAEAWLGPVMEAQSGVGSGLRTSFRDPVGGELELLGWLRPALWERASSDLPRGSWVAVELRSAVLFDFLPGEGEVRLGPGFMVADFGGAWRGMPSTAKALGGLWTGARTRVQLPVGKLAVGGDAQYLLPIASFGSHSDDPLIGRLTRLGAVSAVVAVPVGLGRIELDLGGHWRVDPEADHSTPMRYPVRARIAWMVRP